MTDKKNNLPPLEPDADYDVGYSKPPKSTRFEPGQSGNPSGRPPGAKNKRPKLNEERWKGIILDEAYRQITINEGGRNVTISMAEAVFRGITVNAAKGQQRSQHLFVEMLSLAERENKQLSDEWLKTAIEYKWHWENELNRRKVQGIKNLPDPLPHPDHIFIDFETGEVEVRGPMSKEQETELNNLRECRATYEDKLENINSALEVEKDEDKIRELEGEKESAKKILNRLNVVLDFNGY